MRNTMSIAVIATGARGGPVARGLGKEPDRSPVANNRGAQTLQQFERELDAQRNEQLCRMRTIAAPASPV